MSEITKYSVDRSLKTVERLLGEVTHERRPEESVFYLRLAVFYLVDALREITREEDDR